MLFDGKTALVTGAANRIGAQIARTLHQNGANLIIHYRESVRSAKILEQQLNALRSDSACLLHAEFKNLEEIEDLSLKARQAFGNLDILINSASGFYPTPLGKITEQNWEDLLASNFKAPLFLSQACYPALRETCGAIVNMLDIYASLPLKNHSLYCCAKAANQMLVSSMALEMAPEVRVNGIAPGAILWPENGDASRSSQEKAILKKIPLQATGSPESISQAIMFLLTNNYVTGEVIRVDGGRLLVN